jgi:Beta-L-arabinofuranosidase, GH127
VADLVVETFGTEPGKVDGVCGHPEIETALVELYRETGAESYLERARYFVDRRGHELLGDGRFGRPIGRTTYRSGTLRRWRGTRSVSSTSSPVADAYAETGDANLLQALKRLWAEMVATKTYLTGASEHTNSDEAFGDPYELPNERSYCETCAAISSIMFSWRMLMSPGESKYADLVERTLFNRFRSTGQSVGTAPARAALDGAADVDRQRHRSRHRTHRWLVGGGPRVERRRRSRLGAAAGAAVHRGRCATRRGPGRRCDRVRAAGVLLGGRRQTPDTDWTTSPSTPLSPPRWHL